jgi:8-oxo-dGTP diphosphatase
MSVSAGIKKIIKSRRVAKAALLNSSGEVLLLIRSEKDARMPGEPDFPGGTVDDGEHIEDGVLREIKEETGLVLSQDDLSPEYTATRCDHEGNRILVMFFGRIGAGATISLSHEHSAYEWLSVDAAAKKLGDRVWGDGLRHLAANNIV